MTQHEAMILANEIEEIVSDPAEYASHLVTHHADYPFLYDLCQREIKAQREAHLHARAVYAVQQSLEKYPEVAAILFDQVNPALAAVVEDRATIAELLNDLRIEIEGVRRFCEKNCAYLQEQLYRVQAQQTAAPVV